MVQVRCFLYGLGQGGYIELWMNLAKHTFHRLSAWSFRTFFRLNLSLFSLASGVPWAGKGLPFPFSLDRFLCRCSVNNKSTVRLLGIGSAFWIRLRFKETVRLHLFAPFQMDVTTAAFLVVVVVFTTISRLVAPIWIDLSHFTWQSMRWASEAFIRKVQPDSDYCKT